jgi:hypothetical protein
MYESGMQVSYSGPVYILLMELNAAFEWLKK